MLTPPLVTLLMLVVGLGAVVALVASLLKPDRKHPWPFAAGIVGVVAVGATLPGLLRDRVVELDLQRLANTETIERAARERCLTDVGHPGLWDALGLAREHIPEDGRFRLVTSVTVRPCVTLNLLPRRPAHPYDPARDWTLYYLAAREPVIRAAQRQQALPVDQRRYIFHSEAFIIERPQPESSE